MWLQFNPDICLADPEGTDQDGLLECLSSLTGQARCLEPTSSSHSGTGRSRVILPPEGRSFDFRGTLLEGA
ncbi:hypothetical protein V2G26_006321 [Clonostachys chloroleuca]